MKLDKIVRLTEEQFSTLFKSSLPHQQEAMLEHLGLPAVYIEDYIFAYKLMHMRLLEKINPEYIKDLLPPEPTFKKYKNPVTKEENDALTQAFEGYTRDDK